jgi:pimeloyl-ACP methyl ester carboxylesterase
VPASKSRKITRRYVDLAAGQVHVLTSPGDDPPIVFLHQTASAGTCFERVMETLPLPNRSIAMDTPGFGNSFHPSGWPSMKDYAEYVVATMDRLKARKFFAFGHHTGASLAVELASRYPQRVCGIILFGPVPMNAKERVAFRRVYSVPVAPKADGSHLLHFWNYAYTHNKGCDLEIVHAEVNNMSRAWKGRAQAYRAVSFHDSMKELRAVKCPVLLMTSRGDFFFERFARVRDLRPDADVAIIGGQNFPTHTHAPELGRAIAAFVKRHAEAPPKRRPTAPRKTGVGTQRKTAT